MGTLKVNVLDENGAEQTIFSRGPSDFGNVWNPAAISVDSSGQNFQFVFEGIIGSSFESDIAVDDISYHSGNCPPSRTCDFESSICGWTQETSLDDFDWLRVRALDVPHGTPLGDHTTGTSTGYLLFADVASAQRYPGDQALVYSPSFDATQEGDCMKFWYHIDDYVDAGYIAVWESVNGALIGPYWSSTPGSQGASWQYATVTVKSNATFQDLFYFSFCDFERDYCTWTNPQTGDNFDWTRSSGATPSVTTGPSKDHTLSSPSGHYVYLETSTLLAGDVAWLVSENLPSDDGCFSFWYHMYGAGVGSLNVYLIDGINGNMALQWSQSGNHGDRWIKGQMSTSNPNTYQIAVEATFGGNYTGDIALDDTLISVAGLCNDSSEWDCDFENGWCQYTQAQDDNFDWVRQQGSTGSVGTGPSVDHTTGTANGYYVYIETSSPRVPGDEARIMSPVISTTFRQCLNFWYHMFGPTIETLNVFARRNDSATSDLGNLVWSSQGQKSDEWFLGSVTIAEAYPYQLVFQAYVGSSFTGDIALDDITIRQGDCEATATCDFENSLICGYRQDATDNFDWTYWSGDTPTPLTGPSVDVTYGSAYGHYMYIETSRPNTPGAKARLIGPHVSMETASTTCWTFFFHMYGQDVGTLSVLSNNADATRTTLASYSGNKGNQWYSTSVEVTGNGYEIVFEGTVGNGEEGDIAIDEINMIDGGCDALLDCDFEDGYCQWYNAPLDEFDWIRVQGGTPSASTGPLYDHTLGAVGTGFYVYVEGSAPRLPGDTAKLSSAIFDAGPIDVCFTFWFNMFGQQIAGLRLYKQDTSSGVASPELMWSLDGQQSTDQTHWIQGQVALSGSFLLQFWGVIGSGYYSDIAIDDLEVVPGTCSCQ
ncbi:MAM and LDL-receptor class A domain-containing protein 1-like [Diadema antillarum]|uniref:MAM and LDL-receptor class A domain-containing protein 1-like n=1 Tax=Diadema antillarum TaxID=105358 RepID=UPI003A8940FD